MDAVVALYSDGDVELSEAIVASLSRAIFGEGTTARAGFFQRVAFPDQSSAPQIDHDSREG